MRKSRRLPGFASLSSYLLLFSALDPSFREITRAEPLDTQVTVFSTSNFSDSHMVLYRSLKFRCRTSDLRLSSEKQATDNISVSVLTDFVWCS